jgi:hypothetical protein
LQQQLTNLVVIRSVSANSMRGTKIILRASKLVMEHRGEIGTAC